jgi:hypothetical protein
MFAVVDDVKVAANVALTFNTIPKQSAASMTFITPATASELVAFVHVAELASTCPGTVIVHFGFGHVIDTPPVPMSPEYDPPPRFALAVIVQFAIANTGLRHAPDCPRSVIVQFPSVTALDGTDIDALAGFEVVPEIEKIVHDTVTLRPRIVPENVAPGASTVSVTLAPAGVMVIAAVAGAAATASVAETMSSARSPLRVRCFIESPSFVLEQVQGTATREVREEY